MAGASDILAQLASPGNLRFWEARSKARRTRGGGRWLGVYGWLANCITVSLFHCTRKPYRRRALPVLAIRPGEAPTTRTVASSERGNAVAPCGTAPGEGGKERDGEGGGLEQGGADGGSWSAYYERALRWRAEER
jgi:hypothetical protein